MSLRDLPEIKMIERPKNFQSDVPSDVLAKWAARPLNAASDDDATITIFDIIGEDFWTGQGVTANRISAALRRIGNRDVTVRINSPGGDLFEGMAIFNLLRLHEARVTVEVVGWAASAASIIAMAGDEIRMGLGTFMMVHNVWGLAIGNRHDLKEVADLFERLDAGVTDVYEARSGAKRADIEKMMDAETFMGPSEAVAAGFADVVDDDLSSGQAEPSADNRAVMARRQVEAALARSGYTRQARSTMLSEITGAPRDASSDAARDAGVNPAALRQLIETIKS